MIQPSRVASRSRPRSWALSSSRRWLRPFLGIPLEQKLLGANLVILGVAVLLLFAPIGLNVRRFTDFSVIVGALLVGALTNFALVRLALRPIKTLEYVAHRVSEGRLAERVPPSMVADSELAELSTTINDMLDKLAAGRERMRQLGADVILAEEKERARVARELQDSVAQTLAAAGFQSAALAYEIGDHETAHRVMEIRRLLRSAIEELQTVSRSLHPRVTADLGLPAALEALADATRERSLIDVNTIVNISGVLIPPAVSATMYRIAEEALRNVERHADAGHATVRLIAQPGYVELEVSDDGRGLDGPVAEKRASARFAKMKERLSLAGGDLHIDSTKESGTRVRAWVGMTTEAA